MKSFISFLTTAQKYIMINSLTIIKSKFGYIYHAMYVLLLSAFFCAQITSAQITSDFQISSSGFLPNIGILPNSDVVVTYTQAEKDSLW